MGGPRSLLRLDSSRGSRTKGREDVLKNNQKNRMDRDGLAHAAGRTSRIKVQGQR